MKKSTVSCFALILGLVATPIAWAAEDSHEGNHHPHHIALATGISWHDSKNSAYLGADYVYSRENGWGVVLL